MKRRTAWRNGVAAAARLYAVFAAIWTRRDAKTTTTLIILGVLTIFAARINPSAPRLQSMESSQGILGVLLFISPWVLAFTAMTGMSVTAWVRDIVTIGVTALVMSAGMRAASETASTTTARQWQDPDTARLSACRGGCWAVGDGIEGFGSIRPLNPIPEPWRPQTGGRSERKTGAGRLEDR
ncbi:hypothetical protein ABIB48_000633 [Arthrobacter sp. UYCu511]